MKRRRTRSAGENCNAIAYELASAVTRIDPAKVEEFVEKILHASALFIGGAGRSELLMRCFAMRLMQLGLRCHVVGDTVTPAITRRDLLLVGSGSGETSGPVAVCKQAREKGAAIAVITANAGSSCAGLADIVVDISASRAETHPAMPSVQPLSSLFEQTMFIFLEAVVMELMAATDQSDRDMTKRHANLE